MMFVWRRSRLATAGLPLPVGSTITLAATVRSLSGEDARDQTTDSATNRPARENALQVNVSGEIGSNL